jgi:hypothetical protein
MRLKFKTLVFLPILAVCCAPVCADDGFFSDDGMVLFPSDQTGVRMVSETISLKKVKGEIQAQSDSVFINPNKEAEITMGFPAELPKMKELKRLRYPKNPIKDFTVAVDGQKVEAELKKVGNKLKIKGLSFSQALLWKIRLPQGKPIHVQHTYHFAVIYYSVAGKYHVMDYAHYIPCILKLGGLWAGVPDTLDVTLDLGKDVPESLLEIMPKGYTKQTGVLHWLLKGVKPDNDMTVTVHNAYKDQVSESFLRKYIGLGQPSFSRQEAFKKLNSLEKEVIKNRHRMPKECVKANIALIESFESRFEKE